MIPQFPEFKNLELCDQKEVEEFLKRFPPYSDFNFTSLWVWDTTDTRKLSILNDNLVVLFSDYSTNEPFLSFIGATSPEQTVSSLLDYAKAQGLPGELRLVPEVAIHAVESPELHVLPDPNNFDYVYLTSLLSTMAGNQLKSKRQQADRFLRENEDAHVEFPNFADLTVQNNIFRVIDSWSRMKETEGKEFEIEHEKEAMQRLFKMASSKNFIIATLLIGGEIAAFTIEEQVTPVHAMGHFWKSSGTQTGHYDILAREMARHLEEMGVVYWNWEQDLGIQGLRVSKSSYRPSDFLKKFKVAGVTEAHY